MVSVIIPTYNRAGFLVRAMDSVFAQTHRPIEMILVDDGSTDDTEAVVAAWRGKHAHDDAFTLQYIRQENRGVSAARNRGVAAARGGFLQYLDSDDYLHPRKFEIQIRDIARSGRDASVSDFAFVKCPGGRPLRTKRNSCDLIALSSRLDSVSVLAPLVKRSAVPQEIRWNEDLVVGEDIDYFCRLALAGCSFVHTPHVLAYYHRRTRGTLSGTTTRTGPAFAAVGGLIDFMERTPLPLHRSAGRVVLLMALWTAAGLLMEGDFRRVAEIGERAGRLPQPPMLGAALRCCVAASCRPVLRNVIRLALRCLYPLYRRVRTRWQEQIGPASA